jgi:hypothetical protein
MKYCSKCGQKLVDEALVCTQCGCYVNAGSIPVVRTEESSGLATCALVFAFLWPIVGLILGIIGVCKYVNPELRARSRNAIIWSVVIWALGTVSAVLMALLFPALFAGLMGLAVMGA